MKFTNQPTINREFVYFSKPLSKAELVEIWSRIYEEKELRVKIQKAFCTLNDDEIIIEFNKIMSLEIRSFAPGYFQFKYYRS